MNAKELIDIYKSFFEKRGHKQIANSPLVPENDPTTLFTSSGMQPLVPYLLGETHPSGTRLVNVQNSFRAQDIDEVGDNRHTTFFRMLGNWSLGDYFKKEEIPWLWEFLTIELGLPKDKLFITVFAGDKNVEKDNEAYQIWSEILNKDGFKAEEKIFFAGVDKNWWSRSGVPENMPIDEPGGPDSEVYFRFDDLEHDKDCKDNPVECECGKFLEIANAVFMQYLKTENGFENLPKQNVDFGGGLERLLAAVEQKSDIFQTSLFSPIIKAVENETGKDYKGNETSFRIIADHLVASIFIADSNVSPSNKEQGYILRRLIRRAYDHVNKLGGCRIQELVESVVENYKDTDPSLLENFEKIKNENLVEEEIYSNALASGKMMIEREIAKLKTTEGGELKGIKKIPAALAFKSSASLGLGPTQLESLGYSFDKQEFARLIEEHQKISRAGANKKFKGGLADASQLTIMGHTATHLMHQALRDVLGNSVHQTGSNITSSRVRFDFNIDRSLTEEEIKKVETIVNEKIKENLPVHFEIMPLEKAKKLGAIGLFDEKYQKDVKIYFVGPESGSIDHSPHVHMQAYSREFCGGPHVKFTGVLKKFKIVKQDNIGKGQRRLYVKIGEQI